MARRLSWFTPRSGGPPLPELPDAVEPRTRSRRVVARIVAETRFKLLQQFALRFADLHRCFQDDFADEVTDLAAAYVAHALATQLEHLAGLGFWRNLDRGFAAKGRHFQFRAERGLREADRHFTVQIVVFALEYRVF